MEDDSLNEKITPEDEITEINIDGKIIEIKIKEIELILENTVLKYFDKKEYSILNKKKIFYAIFINMKMNALQKLIVYQKKIPFQIIKQNTINLLLMN